MSHRLLRRRNLSVEQLEPRLFLSATHDPLGLQRTTAPLFGGGDAFATVGDLALFIGGQTGGDSGATGSPYFASTPTQAGDIVDVYNAATGQWSVTHLPHARTGSTAVGVGNDVVVAGGTLGDYTTPVNPIDLYDSTTGSWSSITAPFAVPFTAVAAVGNQAILVPTTPGSAPVQLLDVTTSVFTSRPLASGTDVHVVVAGSKAYFFEDLGAIEIYDSTNGRWTSDFVASDADFTGESTVVDNKIVFAGGDASFQTGLSTGGVLDIVTGLWTSHTALLDARSSVTVVGHKAIFAGGATGGFSPSNHVAIYDAATDQWSASTLSNSKVQVVAFTKGHNAFFIGGTDGGYGDPINTSDVYNDLTGSWSTFTLRHPVASRYGQSPTASLLDGQLIIPGFESAAVFTPSTVAPPSHPGFKSGAGLARSPVALTWDASPGTTHWNVYLDDQLVARTQTNSWKLDRTLTQGAHSWQIVARDATQFTAGPRWTFTVRPPAAVSQPGIRSGIRLSRSPTQLTWAPSAGALRYDLYLDGVHMLATTGTAANLNSAVGGGKHVWSVVARNNLTATPGPVWTFTTPVAPLIHATAPFRMPVNSNVFNPVAAGGKVFYTVDDPTNYFGLDLFAYDATTGTQEMAPFPDYLSTNDSRDGGFLTPAVVGSRMIFRDTETADVYDAARRQFSSYHYFDSPRINQTVAVIGDQAIYAGGVAMKNNVASGDSDAVDIYNAHTGRWYTAKLSVARSGMSIAVVDGKLILAGGSYDSGGATVESNAVDIYDPATGQWTSSTLSVARDVGGVAVAGDLAFFAGGVTGAEDAQHNTPVTDVVDIYDAATGQWSTAHLSAARRAIVTLTVGRYVLFAGGLPASSARESDEVDIYDTQSGQWSAGHLPSPLEEPMNGPSNAATLGNLGFILDGNDAELFDAATGQLSSQPLQGGGGQILTVGRKIVIGGGNSALDVYDADTGQWTVAALSQLDDRYQGVTTGNKAVFQATVDSQGLIPKHSILDLFGDPLSVASLSASVDRTTLHGTVRAGDKGSAVITLRNNGQVPLAAPLTVSVYASPTITLGSGAVMMGTLTLPAQTLATGQSITITIPLIAPARLAPLNYYLVAGVNGGSESILNASPSRSRLRLDPSKPHGAAYA